MKASRIGIQRVVFLGIVTLIYIFLLAPILIIIFCAFDTSSNFAFPPEGFSFRWFISFFSSKTFMRAFFSISMPVALLVSIISTPIGVLGAVGLVRHNFPGKTLVESFFMLPMLVPQVLLGVSLLLFFIKLGIQISLFALIIAHVVITLPYIIRNVSASLYGIPPVIEEAAQMLGASKLVVFFRVTLPLIRSGIVSGAIFSFILSFGDINLALFLTGPRTSTIPVHIFSEIQWQGDPTIAAISTVQVVIVGVMLFMINRAFGVRMTV